MSTITMKAFAHVVDGHLIAGFVCDGVAYVEACHKVEDKPKGWFASLSPRAKQNDHICPNGMTFAERIQDLTDEELLIARTLFDMQHLRPYNSPPPNVYAMLREEVKRRRQIFQASNLATQAD